MHGGNGPRGRVACPWGVRRRPPVYRKTPVDPRIADSARAHRALKLIALRELLDDIPWTHRVDHSFQVRHAVSSAARARLVYLAALRSAPRSYGPRIAWVMPEPHPSNPGHWHVHGLWTVPAGQLWRGWWSDCKEWWGESFGWTRIHALPVGDKAALGGAVSYAAKHHVKAHPISWARYATWYTRTVDSPPVYTMEYYTRTGKRMVLDGKAR